MKTKTDTSSPALVAHSTRATGSASSFDTDYQTNPVCPHCGAEKGDAWEIDFGRRGYEQVEIACPRCETGYLVTRHVEVTYCTEKKPNNRDVPTGTHTNENSK